MTITKNWWFRFSVGLSVLLGCHLLYGGILTPLPTSSPLADSQPDQVEAFLQALWRGERPGAELDPLLKQSGLCWVTAFREGRPFSQESSYWEARASALPRLLADPQLHEREAVEVGVATSLINYNHEMPGRQDAGVWGLLLRCSSGDLLLTPCEFPRRSQFLDGQSIKYRAERTVLREGKFQALTWVLRHDTRRRPCSLVRGDSIVAPEWASRENIKLATREVADYEQRQVRDHHGLLPYSYAMATGATSEEERNLVKVSLGGLSLANYARFTGREEDRKIATQHLKTMIARFGHRWEDGCAISDSEVSLLGVQALFGLALRTLPRPDAFCQEFEQGLARSLKASLHSDGHFRTGQALPGSAPKQEMDLEKDENQNPFPGMALMYLARRSREGSPVVTQESLDRSLQYYVDRFRRRPDKAAIPWLAEAFRQRFGQDRDPRAAESLYLLVDWNLDNLPAWNRMEPQMRGAMINSERLHYGPTCFTSDVGCQVQGLAAAYQVAQSLGNRERSQRYSKAIMEMSRYLRQMQIRDKEDLYWLPVPLREAPLGGLRDATWNYNLQIDSSSSALNAWVEWLSVSGESLPPPR